MTLQLVPLSQRDCADAVRRWHRHHAPPRGDIFRVGVASDGVLVCVGMAGRPVSRTLDDGQTVEVTRVASDGTPNACSMTYAALTRAAWALGYRRVITYTMPAEGGACLRAGWGRCGATTCSTRSGWR